MRMYNEQLSSDPRNQELLGMSAAKALQAYSQILFYSDLRVEADEAKKEEIRRTQAQIREKQDQWIRAKNWPALIQDFTTAVDFDNAIRYSDQRTTEFVKKKMEVRKAENRWTLAFLASYTLA